MPESGLDRVLALSRVGDDVELLREISTLFLEDCPRGLADISAAIDRGDSVKLESAAHGLKGAVANFGAQAAVESAFQLEQMGRAGQLSDAPRMLRTLESALEALCAELKSI